MSVAAPESTFVASKRISTWISDAAYQRFMELAEQEGITMSDRIRALIHLYETDPELAQRVDSEARSLAAEARRRRYGGST